MTHHNSYHHTHYLLRFDSMRISWWDIIDNLRKAYGDNNPYQKMEERPWFTSGHSIHIRRDLYTESFTTFLFLNASQVVDTDE